MAIPDDVVLVFDRDKDLSAFPSAESAANWLEAIDVAAGEYTAAFSTSGLVVSVEAPEGWRGPVLVTRTALDRQGELNLRVADYWHTHQAGQVPRTTEGTVHMLLGCGDGSRQVRTGRRADRVVRNSFEADG